MKQYINQEALDEAIKEFMRVIISGIAPTYTAVTAVIVIGVNAETGAFGIEWMRVLATFTIASLGLIGTALTRAIDRYIHVNPQMKSGGFLPK